MPIGVPRIIYCWGEELPAQWTDIYNFIFRRRMVFLMQYLDDELCNQICGLLINIHMEDRSKELEKKEMEKSGLFKTTTTKSKTSDTIKKDKPSGTTKSSKRQSVEDLLTSDQDFGIEDNYMLEQYTLQKITTEWLNWNAQYNKDFSDEPYLFYLADILSKDFTKGSASLKYGIPKKDTAEMTKLIHNFKKLKNMSKDNINKQSNLDVYSPFRLLANFAPQNYNLENFTLNQNITKQKRNFTTHKDFTKQMMENLSNQNFLQQAQLTEKKIASSEKVLGQRLLKREYNQDKSFFQRNALSAKNSLKAYNYLDASKSKDFDNIGNRSLYRKQTERVIQEEESKKVFMIINSFGGSVGNGITVHDALQFIKAGSLTLALGVAASAASLALAGGTIGERYVTEGCHTMIHQPECLTPDHEVLTDKGWIPVADVTFNHKVACLHPEGHFTYEHPTKLHKYDYDGDMYNVKVTGVDLCVTPNHRMFVSVNPFSKNIEYCLREAQYLLNKRVRYKKDGEWLAPDYKFILPAVEMKTAGNPKPNTQIKFGIMEVTPGKGLTQAALPRILNMEAWLTFFGLWIAEGNTKQRPSRETSEYTVVLTQKKEEGIKIVKQCLEKLNFNFSYSQKQFFIYNKQLFTYLDQFSVGARNKSLPDWVWSLSKKQCQILLDGLILGDGYVNKNDRTRHYFTASIKLANDVARLCLHAGFSASITLETAPSREYREIFGRSIKTYNPMYRVNVLKRVEPFANYYKQNPDDCVTSYKGNVYCLTVPTGVFYVKRNGVSVWTGNSGINGQASDIWIDSQEIMKIRLDVAEIYSLSTYRPRHKILRDLDRDFYLTAMETVYYGLADEIATNEVLQDIIEMTNKVWDYHDTKQQRLLEVRDSQTSGVDTQTQN